MTRSLSSTPTTRDAALLGIGLKIASVVAFLSMATAIKFAGPMPPGQMVFFRSFFALLPICAYLLVTRQFIEAWRTERIIGHLGRGVFGVTAMSLGFFGLTRLPLSDAIAIGYARPLITVVLGALILGEVVRRYRWGAVAVGFAGVMIISWPNLQLLRGQGEAGQALGALATLGGAAVAAFVFVLVRTLVTTEKTTTIVLYFSVMASVLALFTIPFGWQMPTPQQAAALIAAGLFGGIGQLLVTQSYRYAETSVIAPFEYTSIVLSIAIGIVLFAEFPSWQTLVGSAIVVASGIFIIYRERKLGLEREKARQFVTPQG
ncbi:MULTISPECIES: DMT family transporter [unclassified Roseitalea]|uniref:DMT family transporter n=1 Tax=unclassified Roseitalea TaxID=2639107 RepID=UPI00273DE061|nr:MULTISPECIES: DMT family transporter [unclassified Roseitalea]